MEALNYLGVILGSTWSSGINLYLSIAALGISHRMEWIKLPGDMEVIAHPLIILLAVVLFVVEFFADKIPYVDSAWDSVHTIIRPAGGAALAYMATTELAPVAQTAATMIGGAVTMDAHLAKAGTRVAINTSPEPFSNSAASVAEDVTVLGMIWFVIHHPFLVTFIVISFILFSIWFIPKMFRFIRKLFRILFGKEKSEPEIANPKSA